MPKTRNEPQESDAKPGELLAELAESSPIEDAFKETSRATEAPSEQKKKDPVASAERTINPQAPVQPVAVVPFEVFRQVSGVKPDQFAGFARYARQNGMQPQSVANWRREYERFLATAVG